MWSRIKEKKVKEKERGEGEDDNSNRDNNAGTGTEVTENVTYATTTSVLSLICSIALSMTLFSDGRWRICLILKNCNLQNTMSSHHNRQYVFHKA